LKPSLYEEIERLNPAQREAVLSPIDKPIMVVAGAGSGKTRVLTLRVAYLVKEIGIPEYRILAVTFTNKAADEMKERLSHFVNVGRLNIGTFHSVALRMVIEETGKRTVYDEEDVRAIVKDIVEKANLAVKPKDLRLAITRYKNTGRMPDNMEESVFLSALDEYQKRLKEANALDFDDILLEAIRLLEDGRIREKYARNFFYVLVDEYQDTNPLQHRIIKLIAGAPEHRRVFVVGDEDQSIYGFRGADFRIFLNFEQDFPNAKIIKLETNYRSTPQILNLANRLISHNVERRDKVLRAFKEGGPKPQYRQFYSDEDEALWVAKTIKNDGYSYGNVMVLYRTNYLSKSLEDAFLREGIPYVLVGDVSFYQRKEIKDLIAYLRLALNPKDSVSLDRVISTLEGVGPSTAQAIKEALHSHDIDEIDEDILKAYRLRGKRLKKAIELVKLIKDIRLDPPHTALIKVINQMDYFSYIQKNFPDSSTSRKENILQLLDMADRFSDTLELVNQVSLMSSADTKDRRDAVSLMTVHAAKGLEREVVFVIGLEEGTFPHFWALLQKNVEEERRLCYVAVTRAKERLFLSSVQKRGWRNYLDPSRFLEEMEILSNEEQEEDAEKTIKSVSMIRKGDYVRHDRYGIGRVLRVDNDIITVMFSSGKKTFLKDKARLKKL